MGVVEVVVPNMPEAEKIVLVMNKQIAVFMEDQGLNKDLAKRLRMRHGTRMSTAPTCMIS